MRTRTRILDSSVECLAEFGYSSATVQLIAERAGVSRGAQAHHFASKADLTKATIRHLAARHAAAARRAGADLDWHADPVGATLRFADGLYSGAWFAATMELWFAARTESRLRGEMTWLEQEVTADLVATLTAELGGRAGDRDRCSFISTALTVIRGALIADLFDRDPADARLRRRRAAAVLRNTDFVCAPTAAGGNIRILEK